jgi:hypothetical protein
VKAGIVGTDSVEILSGLARGDKVILNPPTDLASGQRVMERR